MAKGITIPIVYKADLAGLSKANSALVGFERQAGLISKIIGTGLVVAATAASAALGGIGFAITKGFGRLQQIEQAEFMLKGLGHTAASIEDIMDSALASVKGTAFGLGDAATIAAQAVAAGVKPGKDLTRVLKIMADTAAITGRPLSDIQSIMGKVITSNRVYRGELNRLSERGLPVIQMLADQMGITGEAVLEMASDGEISADILVEALEGKIGGAALKMGDSTQGAMANTLAAIQRVGANLIGPIYDQFGEFFRAAIEGLSPIEESAKGVGDAIGRFLNPRLDKLVEFVRTLSVPLATVSATFLLVRERAEFFQSKLDPLLDSVSGLSGNLLALAPMVTTIAGIFAEVAVTILPVLLELFTQLVEQVLPAVLGMFAALGPKVLVVAQMFITDLLPVILNLALMALPLLTKIIETLTPVFDFFAKVLIAGDGGLVKLLFTVYLAVTAFSIMATAVAIGKGLMLGMTAATYGVAGATYATTVAQRVGYVVARLFNGSLIAQGVASVAARIGLITATVATVASTTATWAATVAQKALNLAMRLNPIGLIITAVALLVAGLVWFFTKTEMGRKAWAVFTDVMVITMTAVGQWFKHVFTEALPAAWKFFVTTLSDGWNTFSKSFMIIIEVIGAFFEGYINGWIGLFEGFINGIVSGLNWVIKQVNKLKITVPETPFNKAFTMGFNLPDLSKISLPRIALAEGGFVNRPTNALIGEAGPEAVIPLKKMGGMGTTVNITIHAGMGADGKRLGEQIIREIKKYERHSGPVFASA